MPQSFLSNVNINTDESAIMIKGFNICDGTIVAIYAPHADAKNTKPNNLATTYKSTLPDLINFIALVKEPNELANLFVPKATDGGRPIANNAGVEIKPPPPTTESINAAIKPNKIMIIIIVKFKSIV
ncbi:conserved hypothetical protein [Staphylococcus aureus]|nr:conserved hypothetical protein [Staphylococcus aureus]